MSKLLTSDAIHDFETYLKDQEKSSLTIKKYIRETEKFYRFLGRRREFDRSDVLAFKDYLLKLYTPVSVNSMLAALNSFFTFRGWDSLRIKSLKIQKRIFTDEQRELGKEDYRKLLTAAKSSGKRRLYYIMLALGATGIRVSELSYLTVAALKKGQVTVRCKNKTRWILIPEQLQVRLLRYAKETGVKSGAVFVTASGQAVDRSNIWRQMKALCSRTGVHEEKVFPHNFRHLFARTYYQQEKDIVKLSNILGHCSIETTKLYTMTTCREHARQLCGLGLII